MGKKWDSHWDQVGARRGARRGREREDEEMVLDARVARAGERVRVAAASVLRSDGTMVRGVMVQA
jgi:hypothetical protein